MLIGLWFFTKLGIITAYNTFCIRKGNKWKKIFYYQYGHFEYQVIFFGLVNAFTTFQTYIDLMLQVFIDIFVLAYLDNILIFFKKKENYVTYLQIILKKL